MCNLLSNVWNYIQEAMKMDMDINQRFILLCCKCFDCSVCFIEYLGFPMKIWFLFGVDGVFPSLRVSRYVV